MKRFGVWVVAAVLVSVIPACGGGGVKEGMPESPATQNPQAGFGDMMKDMQKEMGKQKKPATAPAADAPKQ
jgi:hypothetical protein